jgi:hypothetical protein
MFCRGTWAGVFFSLSFPFLLVLEFFKKREGRV